ncbi:hypothetical protein [Sphingomonas arenae]|uniref:hypothetical protein n=1 Tax=Sphingomonas arenae TaxID=2812555 RepID=UPI001967D7DC|nr:hypothetical protein [Sphingomonas arenae]
MNRPIALLIAVLLTCLGVTSVGFAAEMGQLRFQLAKSSRDRVQLTLSDGSRSTFSSSYRSEELQGLVPAAAFGPAAGPVRFALVREPGRLDCTGTASAGASSGDCRFTPDQGFVDLLTRRGIGRPTEDQSLDLTMVGANRALVEAIADASYPAPSISDLTGLAALDVDARYIADLSAGGYRPEKIADLLAFKALGVTPAYVAELRRAGAGSLSADMIVQLKALDVSPAYIASLRRVGYGDLSADEIVQLKAMGVTADYIASFGRDGARLPVGKIIEYKALGITPQDARSARRGAQVSISTDDLIRLKVAGLLP